jgi:hypothetical protein
MVKYFSCGAGAVGGQAPFSAPEDISLMPKKVPDPFLPGRMYAAKGTGYLSFVGGFRKR